MSAGSPCIIPTGNLLDTPTFSSLEDYSFGNGSTQPAITPAATAFITKLFIDQRIPDLPQACGLNCRYNVSIPSFVFQCTPNPSLPYDQTGDVDSNTIVNVTIDPNSFWGFYIGWQFVDSNRQTTWETYLAHLFKLNTMSRFGYLLCLLVYP